MGTVPPMFSAAEALCGTPAQRKPGRPVFQPRDQGEVFWNTALLSIEQTSFLLLHEYDYKVSNITMKTSARLHYAILSCSMQAVEPLEAAE